MRQLGESTWVLEGPTNIGFIERDNEVILIDSGNDKDSGRRINKIVKERGWNLKAVLNTHSNADHIGGNDYFQRNTGCEIYAPEIEKAYIENPELEAAFLWGGFAVKDLRNKFFCAKPSTVTGIVSPGDEIENGIEIIGLKGHFKNMVGARTPDDVLFLADCLFGKNILEKYGVPFVYDVRSYKETIRQVREMEAACYVPSHGSVEEDIKELADFNLALVDEIEVVITGLLETEMGFDGILQGVCDSFGINLNAGQYALVGSTLRSFLSYLHDEAKIDFVFTDNRMLWRAAAG